MEGLTPRKEQILKAVIVEYVTGAEPVPSDTIVRKYEIGVRSATIRNEMAEITELGLLEQPHTSAGRVPSDRGYRYYVDRLVVHRPPEPPEQRSVEEAASDEDTLQEVLQETTKALSRLTHLLTAATVVKNNRIRVRSCIVTAIGPGKALLVLVLENGQVENRIIEAPATLTLAQLGDVNAALAHATEGLTLAALARSKAPAMGEGPVARLARSALQGVKAACKDLTRGRLIMEGEEYILAQPEFQRNADEARQVLASMEDEDALRGALEGEGVTIGHENLLQSLHGLTILRKAFYVGPDEAGNLAIVGPTRLQYDRAISLLDFTAHAVSHTLTRLMG